jgi:hypothetical protein
MLRLVSIIYAVLSILVKAHQTREEVIAMDNRYMLVLEEGTCPFMGGPDFACCFGNLGLFR